MGFIQWITIILDKPHGNYTSKKKCQSRRMTLQLVKLLANNPIYTNKNTG